MKSTGDNGKEFSSDDEASPRGILEAPVSGTESDHSGSSDFSSFSSEKSAAEVVTEEKEVVREVSVPAWKSMIDVFKFKTVRRLTAIPLLVANHDVSKKGLSKKLARIRSAEDSIDIGAIPTKPSWRNFEYAELVAATNDFKNLVGKGGHAEVYKGQLPDGQVIAVKRLMKNEKDAADRAGDFLTELGIIAHINHPNATRLVGFGIDRGLYFVLQFAPQGSLASMLFGSECLEWKMRFKVATGVAEGLHYLHRDCPRRIIHRDIKASNILLNENNEAEISDFGLAKWLPNNWAHHVVFPIEGTFGYLAPEYFMHGLVDEKTDVFAFGVLLLELITGRRAVDSNSRQSLVIWAKPLLDSNNVKEIVDPRLEENYDPTEMKLAMATASMCVHHTSSKRPYMNQVVQLLKGEETIIDAKPTTVAQKSLMLEACDLEDYTCSNYLKDLNRHRQLVME
ncbi:receptor-like cytosolic serine/threonine-protein kinase RBK1 isoform X2 [Lotus japonicus]|uniref:receptor-like cytosolic serine/threonine-protein kinase RBK1 isoform X2 n=1 Tax=Lotus japonicus TaxID=34305 RepID=UPI002590E730|nr:receptor-like cytosolic serine/threonine-protein kinase RBK1 isoform X2 [Lotus japonicus]